MPINKKYPLKQLLAACAEYFQRTNRQVTFEYTLIRGINSDLQSALKLATIIGGFDSKINIIPANPVKECSVGPPGKLEILLFRDTLLKAGVNVTLRKPRGEDIDAACGQLRLRYAKK
jgi:23S rRNA (adenine2503-C2)-methyltransferase